MPHSATPSQLIHRTTIALTQLHRLLQQATDILAHLHNLYLLHTGQVDPNFQRTFPSLPAPPTFTAPIPSPTSSCDSAPIEPIKRAPRQQTHSSSDTPPPEPPQPKKKRQPPPPLNSNADWDDWDGEADLRLIELKTDSRLRPNWNYVARRVGFSIEQCQSRWQELQEEQRRHDTSTQQHPSRSPSPNPSPSHLLLPHLLTHHLHLLLAVHFLPPHHHRRCPLHPHSSHTPWQIIPILLPHFLFHHQQQMHKQLMRKQRPCGATTVRTVIRNWLMIVW